MDSDVVSVSADDGSGLNYLTGGGDSYAPSWSLAPIECAGRAATLVGTPVRRRPHRHPRGRCHRSVRGQRLDPRPGRGRRGLRRRRQRCGERRARQRRAARRRRRRRPAARQRWERRPLRRERRRRPGLRRRWQRRPTTAAPATRTSSTAATGATSSAADQVCTTRSPTTGQGILPAPPALPCDRRRGARVPTAGPLTDRPGNATASAADRRGPHGHQRPRHPDRHQRPQRHHRRERSGHLLRPRRRRHALRRGLLRRHPNRLRGRRRRHRLGRHVDDR